MFVDTDVLAPPDLLDRYFAQPPADETGVLAGAVLDETPPDEAGHRAVRYAYLKASMSQEITLADARWAFAQTANAAVRRAAFAQVGGFEAAIRSGGDADLCFRLRAAGWALERREQAAVVHHNRTTVARMLGQRAPRRRCRLAVAPLAGGIAAAALARPGAVGHAPRCRRSRCRRARRSRRGAARPARWTGGVGVRTRTADSEPAATAACRSGPPRLSRRAGCPRPSVAAAELLGRLRPALARRGCAATRPPRLSQWAVSCKLFRLRGQGTCTTASTSSRPGAGRSTPLTPAAWRSCRARAQRLWQLHLPPAPSAPRLLLRAPQRVRPRPAAR